MMFRKMPLLVLSIVFASGVAGCAEPLSDRPGGVGLTHHPDVSPTAEPSSIPAPGDSPEVRPSGRIDVSTFRTRLPTIGLATATVAACPGGDAVFHSDGMNAATATVRSTTYVLEGHPTMPDSGLPSMQTDLDGDGVQEIIITIACEPEGGVRTVNLYVLKQTSQGYKVLDVPFTENPARTPRVFLFSFGVVGRTLVITLNDVGQQPDPHSSSIFGEHPRDVIMEWNGKAFVPGQGIYHW